MVDYFSSETVASLKANGPVPPKRVYDALVRVIDLLVPAVGLFVCLPLLVTVALLVKLSDGGPVLFRQQRTGKNGRPFSILKFRTMVVNAEQIGERFSLARNDPRVTRVGRFLREYHLDELPQLINVLKGEMSLVGPRPALAFQKDYYEAWELPRLLVAPGMTGLAQVIGGNSLDWDQRILLDVYYVRHRHFWLYIQILIKTFLRLFVKSGIYNREKKVQGWNRPVPEWYQGPQTPAPESR
jgi:lipopolysaccharide/colanic/teichoic acid biosynthesis glycosyltransferase